MQPLVMHHLEHSRARRIVWLLEELAIPYEIKAYQRNPKTMLAPPNLRAVHPLGKSPLVTDPNRGNCVLAESGAIVEYLVEHYGQGRLAPPAGSDARQRFTYWQHYAEGSIMPLMLLRLIFNQVKKSPAPFFIKPILKGIDAQVTKAFIGPEITLHLSYIDAELGKNPAGWFVGDAFSAADVLMSFPLEAAMQRARADANRPNIVSWLEKISARPAYLRACEVTGEAPWKP
jgi:glutathione S-transferase